MNLEVLSRAESDGVTVLEVSGSIDVANRERLASAAQTAVDDGVRTLIVDLSAVTFIDSTGVGVLVDLAGDAGERGGTFLVRDPSRPVVRILEVAGLAEQWQEPS